MTGICHAQDKAFLILSSRVNETLFVFRGLKQMEDNCGYYPLTPPIQTTKQGLFLPGVSMTLKKNGSMPPLFWIMTPFFKGHGDLQVDGNRNPFAPRSMKPWLKPSRWYLPWGIESFQGLLGAAELRPSTVEYTGLPACVCGI